MYPNLAGLQWVGKLSLEDADILAQLGKSKIVLEQGAGGSTLIFKQTASKLYTVEPETVWIEKTQQRLGRVDGCEVSFINQEELSQIEPVDLIFVDGPREQRASFATEAWPRLKVGGSLLFHDTRRDIYQKQLLTFVYSTFNYIDEIQVNMHTTAGLASNLSLVRKRTYTPYKHWVLQEEQIGRPPWSHQAELNDERLWICDIK